MKKLLLFSLLSACTAFVGNATLISSDQALKRALSTGSADKISALNKSSKFELAYTGKSGGIYLFNNIDKNGYLIVAGSDNCPAVIGYGDSGNFEYCDAAPAFIDILDSLDESIASERKMPTYHARDYVNIEPMIKTKWDQKEPYNQMAPKIGSTATMTGCVATAMAQVMKYWEYPACGSGSNSYYWTSGAKNLTCNFYNAEFNYDKMLDQYISDSGLVVGTSSEKMAVATLMYACGIASNMDYSTTFSGSTDLDCAHGLANYFSYDPGMKILFRNFYRIGEWTDMVYDELKAGRPVLYYGFSPAGGHAFVCDGYNSGDADYFHFNWGWSGVSDGYFRINALDPEYLGSGASATGFNRMQSAIFGCKPLYDDEPTAVYDKNMLCFGYFAIGATSYKRNENVLFGISNGILRAGIYNMSTVGINCTLGVKLTPEDGDPQYVAAGSESNLEAGGSASQFVVTGSQFPVGKFICTPAYQVDGTWYDIPQEYSMKTLMECTVTDDNISFDISDDSNGIIVDDMSLSENKWYIGSPVTITAEISSYDFSDEDTDLTPTLIKDGYIISSLYSQTVRVPEDETATVTWNVEVPEVEPGTYSLGLLNGKCILQGDMMKVVVIDPNADVELALSGVRINRSLADASQTMSLTGEKISFACNISCESGVFDGDLNVAVLDSYDNVARYVSASNKSLSLITGDESSISFSGDMSGVYSNEDYSLALWDIAEGKVIGDKYPVVFPNAPAGVETISIDNDPAEYYNLQGIRVTAPVKGDVVIERTAGKAHKIIVNNSNLK